MITRPGVIWVQQFVRDISFSSLSRLPNTEKASVPILLSSCITAQVPEYNQLSHLAPYWVWFHTCSLRYLPDMTIHTGKTLYFENGTFRKRWRRINHVTSLPEVFENENPKWLVIIALLNFSRASVDRKRLMRFQSENAVFEFLCGVVCTRRE